MLSLTPAAVAKVADLIAGEDDDGIHLRVQVRPGGCSGYSYEMSFDTEIADDDTVSDQGAGDAQVSVVVDATSGELLRGATIDYVEGLNGTGFKVTNPNARRSCGCGQSFS